ncbi:MAG: DUF3617 domain-containing protein [Sphingomonadales bacterium]
MRVFVMAMAAASVAIPAGFAANSYSVKPGKYQIEGLMKMPMMPNGMPVNREQCITADEADMSAEQIASQMAAGGNCAISDLKSSEASMDFNFQCNDSDMGPITGAYTINFTPTGYTVSGDVASSGMNMTMEMEASRIGDC